MYRQMNSGKEGQCDRGMMVGIADGRKNVIRWMERQIFVLTGGRLAAGSMDRSVRR